MVRAVRIATISGLRRCWRNAAGKVFSMIHITVLNQFLWPDVSRAVIRAAERTAQRHPCRIVRQIDGDILVSPARGSLDMKASDYACIAEVVATAGHG